MGQKRPKSGVPWGLAYPSGRPDCHSGVIFHSLSTQKISRAKQKPENPFKTG